GSARLAGGKLVGTIKNTSSLQLTDGVVLLGNSYQTFGALAPGAETTFSFAPVEGNPFMGAPAYQSIYPNNMFSQQGPVNYNSNSDSERIAEAKSAVLSTLPVNGQEGAIGVSQPIAVGWNTQPLRDITVDGAHPRFYALTALVTSLPLVEIGAGSLPAGVVAGRPVDVDGQVQPQGGPPGYLFIQGGSVTYDFAPRLTAGAHLFHVAVSSSNVGGGKFLGPNGTASSITAQVWDWAGSEWVNIKYADGGSTEVPDSAVNPTTGEVRLKLSTDGTSITGWMSLTGELL
ncbi:MAG TPA: hypothetical protein VET26_04120, partial [Candidatus Sulfotelmatobacter sp.]|nr:hypothetical protein [Candidatus Sulfotelmatobacter sp.]